MERISDDKPISQTDTSEVAKSDAGAVSPRKYAVYVSPLTPQEQCNGIKTIESDSDGDSDAARKPGDIAEVCDDGKRANAAK